MFKPKKRDASSLTILAKGDRIEGTMRVLGTLHVDGEVDGSVFGEGQISIGPDATVKGEVRGMDVSVAGRIEGIVRARGVLHMRATGVVEGDAYFDALVVDRGGVVYGRTAKIDEAPKDAPKLALAEPVPAESTKNAR